MNSIREYRGPECFQPTTEPYRILPFRFHPIHNDREVLVNEVGDYLVCPRGTATRIVNREVSCSEPLFADLLGNFFVSDVSPSDILDVIATRYRTKKAFLNSFTSLHIFVMTLRCNHTCQYCQVSRQTQEKRQYDMTTTSLDCAIAHMFRSPSPQLTVEFQGGEPMLAFESVKYAVEAILRLNAVHKRQLTFVICTNLSVASDEMLAYCAERAILISTSLDGPSDIHDTNRPISRQSSHELFVDGLQRARTIVGHDRVSALMTTSRLSLESGHRIVDSYLALGFSRIFLRPLNPFGFATKLGQHRNYDVDEFLVFYKKTLDYIISLNRRGIVFIEDYAAIILRKMLTPYDTGYVDLQSPAGAVTSVVVYNYDGDVYASDESRMLAETGDTAFRLGQVTDSYESLFHGPVAQTIVEHSVAESLAGCSDCGYQAYCGSDPVRHHATQGDIEGFRPESGFCRKNMAIMTYLIELMDSDPAIERIFRNWVSG